MIFVTGDTHGTIDFNKVRRFAESEGKNLTKNDFLIVAGDFGVIWDASNTKYEKKIINSYNDLPFTTLFIDGNHENHDRLEKLSTEEKFGADVGVVSESIFHLRRGRIYNIDGQKIWTFGGGYSVDKESRQEFLSWWKQELPTIKEMNKGFQALEGSEIDFIITHAAPRDVFESMLRRNRFQLLHKNAREEVEFQLYLQYVANNSKFKHWFFGHYHLDIEEFEDKFVGLYNRVIKLS